MNETAVVRPYVACYCRGLGVDIGCGYDKITREAIGIDYAHHYNDPLHPHTDADIKEPWEQALGRFDNDSLHFVYSSHLLEDYEQALPVLEAWVRVIKPGGYLVLYLPIEHLLAEHCGADPDRNTGHKQAWRGPIRPFGSTASCGTATAGAARSG